MSDMLATVLDGDITEAVNKASDKQLVRCMMIIGNVLSNFPRYFFCVEEVSLLFSKFTVSLCLT